MRYETATDLPVAWTANLQPTDDFEVPSYLADITPLLMRLLKGVGDDTASRLLDVPRTTIIRWRNGGRIESCAIRRILDIHDALTRSLQVFNPAAALKWFLDPEPFFYGSRPIDVLDARGLAPILDALKQYKQR